MEDRKYLWSWDRGADNTSGIITIQIVPMKEFDEVGQYTKAECQLLTKLSQEIPAPVWLEWKWLPDGTNTNDQNRRNAEAFNTELMKRFNEQK
jgi:hypothetical protein